MQPERLDRSGLQAARVLHGIRVDRQLVDAEISGVGVLAREELAVFRPAGGRRADVRVRRAVDRRKNCAAAGTSGRAAQPRPRARPQLGAQTRYRRVIVLVRPVGDRNLTLSV